jgi:2'-5' RNA ligase
VAATAIVVPVLEAEPSVDCWRRRYTQDGADGMPPHVTLLYPFVDDRVLVGGHVCGIRRVLACFAPLDFELRGFAEFPSTEGAPVLYLEPDPTEPFLEMTAAIARVFPDYPPYGGQFAEIIPHLTIAEHAQAPLSDIRDDVASVLPIAAQAREAWLMQHGTDGWRMRNRIDLSVTGEDYRDEPL